MAARPHTNHDTSVEDPEPLIIVVTGTPSAALRERHQKARAVLRSFQDDDPDEQRETLEYLEQALREDRYAGSAGSHHLS